MFYKEDVKIQLKDFGKNGFIKNRAILEMFENVATYQADIEIYSNDRIDIIFNL